MTLCMSRGTPALRAAASTMAVSGSTLKPICFFGAGSDPRRKGYGPGRDASFNLFHPGHGSLGREKQNAGQEREIRPITGTRARPRAGKEGGWALASAAPEAAATSTSLAEMGPTLHPRILSGRAGEAIPCKRQNKRVRQKARSWGSPRGTGKRLVLQTKPIKSTRDTNDEAHLDGGEERGSCSVDIRLPGTERKNGRK